MSEMLMETKKKRAPRVKKETEPVLKPKKGRLVKGSQEAKDYMKKLRDVKKMKQKM